MTATLIGVLVERGKLRWDSTIGEVFTDMAQNFPKDFGNITLLQLLSHHAGLTANISWHDQSITGSLIEQRRVAVRLASEVKLLSRPGTRFLYSNLGYVIAAAMAESVMGTDWETLVTDLVFKPLGMENIMFGGTGTPGQIDQPWPHYANGQPTRSNGVDVDNPPVMNPAGRVNCTLTEWSKFIADQLRGDRGEPALLKYATYKRLHTPPFVDQDYARGWLVAKRPWGGGTVYTHSGSNTMNYAVVWIAPQRDFAVLIVTNQGGDAAAKGCDVAVIALIKLYKKP
jgi:CubicO group peptidase (beta-lactamase class C family)